MKSSVVIFWNAHIKTWVLVWNGEKTYHSPKIELQVPSETIIDQFKLTGQGEAYIRAEGYPVSELWENGLSKIVVKAQLSDGVEPLN